MNNLVQIQPAARAPKRKRMGTLSPQLTDPSRYIYRAATRGVDLIEQGLQSGERRLVQEGHTLIFNATRTIKRKLCEAYHYAAPDPQFPDQWDVVCTSGHNGKFLRRLSTCSSCLLFNTDHNPAYVKTLETAPPGIVAEVLGRPAA
jgi:hypothetical protein